MEESISRVDEQINKTLYRICLWVTVVAITMSLIRFFTRGAYPPDGISIFYIGVLALYSLHKEALHWLMEKEDIINRRRGEMFVYVWLIITLFLYIVNFLTKDYYNYSPEGEHLNIIREISFITLEVGGIFVLSRFLKIVRIYYQRKFERREDYRHGIERRH